MRMAMNFVTSLLLLLVADSVVFAQINDYATCHVGMCLGSSQTSSQTQYLQMGGAAIKYVRGVYANNEKSSVSAAIYAEGTQIRYRCTPRDAKNRAGLFNCFYNVFSLSRPMGTNNLDSCLETMCNHNSFYKNTVYRYKYDLVIITDSASYNENRTADWFERCTMKGFSIMCVVIGKDIAATSQYDEYCHYVRRVDSYNEISKALDGLSKNTCEEPPERPHKVCENLKMKSGTSSSSHPLRCDSSVRCEAMAGVITKSTVKACACGMFWDAKKGYCRGVQSVTCSNDVCRLYKDVDNYAFTNNCRQYWDCGDGRTARALCCADTERYDVSLQGCVPDEGNKCKDSCDCTFESPPLPNCGLRVNKNDPRTYLQILWGSNSMVRPCARGTRYNATSCRCDIHVYDAPLPEDEKCSPDFEVRYTESPLKDHGNNAAIRNRFVNVDKALKQGTYAAGSRLIVRRFDNYDWRYHFAFSVLFNDDGNTNNDAVLLTNQGCGLAKSVEIRLDRDNNNQPIVVCDLTTSVATYTLSAPYKVSENNQVYASLNDGVFRLNIGYADRTMIKRTATVNGPVLRRGCYVTIGSAGRSFRGRMMHNEVYIANCLPKSFL